MMDLVTSYEDSTFFFSDFLRGLLSEGTLIIPGEALELATFLRLF